MSDTNHRPRSDVLNQAVEALRDAPTPAGPPADLTAATLAAVENRLRGTVPSETARQLQRRATVMRYVRFGSLATAAAVLVGVVALLLNPRPAVAMDKVLDKAAQADAVRYEVRTMSDLADNTAAVTVRGKQVRVESGDTVTFVIDWETSGMLILSHPNKTYQTVDLAAKAGGIAPFDIFAVKFRDQLAALKKEKFESAGTEKVGEVKTEKVTATGVSSLGMTGDWTVWVDPKTEYPVKIEVEATRGKMTVFRSYGQFDWAPKVNKEMFSLDPPEGYAEGTVFHTVPPLTPIKKDK
jgi:hypothetical protein